MFKRILNGAAKCNGNVKIPPAAHTLPSPKRPAAEEIINSQVQQNYNKKRRRQPPLS